MRARIVELDGTPDEVAQVLAQVQATQASAPEEGVADSSGVSEEVREWFRYWKVRGPQREYIEQLVQEVQSWGDVEVKILHGRGDERFSGRLRFVRTDQREAFAILGRRGFMWLQLPKDSDLSGYEHAKLRNTSGKRHPVVMYVRSADAIREAVELLKTAYELQSQS